MFIQFISIQLVHLCILLFVPSMFIQFVHPRTKQHTHSYTNKYTWVYSYDGLICASYAYHLRVLPLMFLRFDNDSLCIWHSLIVAYDHHPCCIWYFNDQCCHDIVPRMQFIISICVFVFAYQRCVHLHLNLGIWASTSHHDSYSSYFFELATQFWNLDIYISFTIWAFDVPTISNIFSPTSTFHSSHHVCHCCHPTYAHPAQVLPM